MTQRRFGGAGVGVVRAEFRPSAVFVGIVAVFVGSGVLAWRGVGDPGVDVFFMIIAGWLVSLSLHEYAHALVAYRGGDVSVAAKGYLTLNPLRYSHPLLSIALPVLFVLMGGIGLPGGAVWIDHHALRGRLADSLVSAAGPAVNVACTLAVATPFALGVDTSAHETFWAGLAFLGFLQLTASMLNLLPVPGLDGGNLISPWLSYEWRRRAAVIAPYGMLIVFALLFEPRVRDVFFSVVYGVSDFIGLPSYLYWEGLNLMRFWQ
jgi:Zn-dependent protease